MKSLEHINELLETFQAKYKLPVLGAQQQSEAWFQMKLGVISASNASKVVAKKDSETRLTYMCELVAQVCTGLVEEISSKYIEWGNQHEDAARSSYELMTGNSPIQVPFIFKDAGFRVGCSPDAINPGHSGVEIKCPFNTVHYIKFLAEDRLKPEYVWQNQFQMWVGEADLWHACQYDPRMKSSPLHLVMVKRDAEKIKALEDLVPAFIHDMDEMLKKIGVPFGEQWTRIAQNQRLAVAT